MSYRRSIAELILLGQCTLLVMSLAAQVPDRMNFQGKLIIDGKVARGDYDLTFTLYPDSLIGTGVWSELHQDVEVTNGIFSVILGSQGTPLPGREFSRHQELFLGVKVDGGAEMRPRFHLTSVAFAFQAGRADTAEVAIKAIGNSSDSFWSKTGTNIFYNEGNVGIGISNPAQRLHVVDGSIQVDIIDKNRERGLIIRNTDLPNSPQFEMGRIVQGGDGSPELRFMFRDIQTSERSVFEFDSSGIVASVRSRPGAHFEGFIGGDAEPLFRLNSFPSMQLEFGQGGTIQPDVIIRRTTDRGLSFFTGGKESMFLSATGNLAIGGTSFSSTAGLTLTAGNDHILIEETDQSADKRFWIIKGEGGDLEFITADFEQGLYPPALVCSRAGRTDDSLFVGIGTSAPTQRLHVSGGGIRLDNNQNLYWRDDNKNVDKEVMTYRGSTTIIRGGEGNPSLKLQADADTAVAVLLNSGNFGIGMDNPQYKLHVNGRVAGMGPFIEMSDVRYKQNLAPISTALDKISRLRGVSYEWRRNEYPELAFDDGRKLGFIAQEVQEVLPEVVTRDGNGVLSVAYSHVVPVLVEAVKEQQAVIDKQKSEIAELSARLAKLEAAMEKLSGSQYGTKASAGKNAGLNGGIELAVK